MSTRHTSTRFCQLQAFTLVELLVVIGIIALLISMLLPALNGARQQANSIDCQARLRQMGQALAIYSADNKGLLPWGVIDRKAIPNSTWTSSTADAEQFWWWYYTISNVLDRHLVNAQGQVDHLSPIFADRDTIEPTGTPTQILHYTANQRLFWQNSNADSAPAIFSNFVMPAKDGNTVAQRRMGSVKPTGVFVIWDSSQVLENANNSYGLATELDGNRLSYGHGFCLGSPNTAENYNRPITPGGNGLGEQSELALITKTTQKTFNRDLLTLFTGSDAWNCQLRFRHLKNSSLNALCLDGHVESRKVGEAMVRDFCTNYPY